MSEKIILGIETSCDDTSIALVKADPEKALMPQSERPNLLVLNSFSQEMLLEKWGGVVPEIAARNHMEKIVPLLKETLKKANITLENIDCIAVTTHPGLMGPLLTGITVAKTLSLILKKPIASVNHLYAHLEAIHLDREVQYPYLGLLVSGGHSLYLKVDGPTQFEILGNTIDDAAGEAFDKGGKLLGLGYPAGRIIDERAKLGNPKAYEFPIGLTDSKDANLSYSGVKTSLRLFLETHQEGTYNLDDVIASYQEAIVDALVKKMHFALLTFSEKTGIKNPPIVIGGGVAANSRLRTKLQNKYGERVNFVRPLYCTDNGAMIANYALRTFNDAVPFPACLSLDPKNQFVSKDEKFQKAKGKKT